MVNAYELMLAHVSSCELAIFTRRGLGSRSAMCSLSLQQHAKRMYLHMSRE